jgi:hypothetical protein
MQLGQAGRSRFNFMPATIAEGPEYREFIAALRFLEAEGFIVRWTDAHGNEWVRIADGAENAKL